MAGSAAAARARPDPAPRVAERLDLDSAVEQLYGAPIGEFMVRRTALVAEAKRLGDKELAAGIGTLRKPSVAAGIINTVVRGRPDVREALEHVGARLRAAQATMHGTALTALRPDRDRLIEDFLAAAREVARGFGQTLTPAAAAEIRDTVIAAIASEQAAVAVTSGHLTRSLSYSGFGEVDLADAIVTTRNGTLLRVLPGSGGGDGVTAADAGSAPPARTAVTEPAGATPSGTAPVEARLSPGGGGDVGEPGTGGGGDPGVMEAPAADAEPGAGAAERGAGDDGPRPAELGPGRDMEVDPEVAAAEAAAAYAAAAAAVVTAKSAARTASSDVDRLKEAVARLGASLESAQRELEAAFALDADARVAVTAAIAIRQRAAAALAAAQALDED